MCDFFQSRQQMKFSKTDMKKKIYTPHKCN